MIIARSLFQTVGDLSRALITLVIIFFGACFLKHPKVQKNQILKWSLRVPKSKSGGIGMVIILKINNI